MARDETKAVHIEYERHHAEVRFRMQNVDVHERSRRARWDLEQRISRTERELGRDRAALEALERDALIDEAFPRPEPGS